LAYVILPAWWKHHERGAPLKDTPKLTRTSQGIPGDPVNVALVGSQLEVVHAFIKAGWSAPVPTTVRTALRISESVVLGRAYSDAPVSNLYLFGRKQDLAFEKPVGKGARRRHHVRFWRVEGETMDGRPVWLGAATYDRSVGFSHRTGQITHHIGPDVDTERDFLMDELLTCGQVTRTYRIPGIGPTDDGRNGGKDRYYTDGEIVVGALLPQAITLGSGE
jgi:hypothetical protein